ncbi:hypothetical protein BY996DRAFT_6598764 [Phakopsora pachyrhizi]|nr:hypothetical protein BY996DRAFT_6598764 [Phakopsora pachyrhizi]
MNDSLLVMTLFCFEKPLKMLRRFWTALNYLGFNLMMSDDNIAGLGPGQGREGWGLAWHFWAGSWAGWDDKGRQGLAGAGLGTGQVGQVGQAGAWLGCAGLGPGRRSSIQTSLYDLMRMR